MIAASSRYVVASSRSLPDVHLSRDCSRPVATCCVSDRASILVIVAFRLLPGRFSVARFQSLELRRFRSLPEDERGTSGRAGSSAMRYALFCFWPSQLSQPIGFLLPWLSPLQPPLLLSLLRGIPPPAHIIARKQRFSVGGATCAGGE